MAVGGNSRYDRSSRKIPCLGDRSDRRNESVHQTRTGILHFRSAAGRLAAGIRGDFQPVDRQALYRNSRTRTASQWRACPTQRVSDRSAADRRTQPMGTPDRTFQIHGASCDRSPDALHRLGHGADSRRSHSRRDDPRTGKRVGCSRRRAAVGGSRRIDKGWIRLAASIQPARSTLSGNYRNRGRVSRSSHRTLI